MADVVRMATVGAGRLSTAKIYPCFSALPVELVAVCDLDEARAADRARRFGGKAVYRDFDVMLRREQLDALIVCIGPSEHARVTRKALEAGLAVYTEKPPAPTAAETLELARLAQAKSLLVMTAFKKRYTPIYVAMKEAMGNAEFGESRLLSVRRSAGPYPNDGDPSREFLLDFGIHMIDLAVWLMGPPVEVFAQSAEPNAWAVSVTFPGGAVGSLAFAAYSAWRIPDEQVAVYGSGSAFIESRDMRQLWIADRNQVRETYRLDLSTSGADGLEESGFRGELEAFIRAVQSGDRSGVRSDIAASYRSMMFYDAIKRSAMQHTPIRVTYEL